MTDTPEWFTSNPDETVVWTGTPRVWRVLPTVAGALFWAAAGVAAAWAVTEFVGPLPVSRTVVWGVAAAFVVVQAVRVALAFARVAATDYVLTDRNVYKKTGVFSETVTRVGVDRVQTTRLSKDVTGTLFDHGTVSLSTADGGGLAVTDLDDPEAFRDALRPLMGAPDPGENRAGTAIDGETVAALLSEARRLRESTERVETELDS